MPSWLTAVGALTLVCATVMATIAALRPRGAGLRVALPPHALTNNDLATTLTSLTGQPLDFVALFIGGWANDGWWHFFVARRYIARQARARRLRFAFLTAEPDLFGTRLAALVPGVRERLEALMSLQTDLVVVFAHSTGALLLRLALEQLGPNTEQPLLVFYLGPPHAGVNIPYIPGRTGLDLRPDAVALSDGPIGGEVREIVVSAKWDRIVPTSSSNKIEDLEHIVIECEHGTLVWDRFQVLPALWSRLWEALSRTV